MRNEDDRLFDAIDESIECRTGKCPPQISHLKTQGPRNWNKLDDVFRRSRTHARGRDITFDRYPYIAYQTGLTNLFPVWSRDGGTAAFLRRLDDPSTADRIKREALAKVDLIGGWDNVLISSAGRGGDSTAAGKRLGAYAKSKGVDPYEATVALLRASNASTGMVGFAMSEDNLDRILAHPLGMVCSDGGAFAVDGPSRRGSPHPRGLGTFPRVLGRYVRERKALTLEQAVRKMTAMPAARLKLADRGRIAPKLAADLVVFGPVTIIDKATYEDPFQYPEGIRAVVVNRPAEDESAAAGGGTAEMISNETAGQTAQTLRTVAPVASGVCQCSMLGHLKNLGTPQSALYRRGSSSNHLEETGSSGWLWPSRAKRTLSVACFWPPMRHAQRCVPAGPPRGRSLDGFSPASHEPDALKVFDVFERVASTAMISASFPARSTRSIVPIRAVPPRLTVAA
jgi:N-acyl-D-aspartate/D-glutamate deacylase